MITRIMAIASFIVVVTIGDTLAGAIIVDNYFAGSTIARFSAGTTSQITVDSSIFGGTRTDSLTVRDLGGAEFFGVMGFGGNLAIAQSSTDKIFGSVEYASFGSVDITEAGGNTRFVLQLAGTDSATPVADAFSITVGSGGSTSKVNFDIPGSGSVPTQIWVDFTEFSGVDLTNVDSIVLAYDFDGAPGHDVTLGQFSIAVPEPSSCMVLGLGMMACLIRRRR